jgi:hypothetical protein
MMTLNFEELDFGCNFSFHVTSLSFYVISFKCNAIAYALHLRGGGCKRYSSSNRLGLMI